MDVPLALWRAIRTSVSHRNRWHRRSGDRRRPRSDRSSHRSRSAPVCRVGRAHRATCAEPGRADRTRGNRCARADHIRMDPRVRLARRPPEPCGARRDRGWRCQFSRLLARRALHGTRARECRVIGRSPHSRADSGRGACSGHAICPPIVAKCNDRLSARHTFDIDVTDGGTRQLY